MRDMRKFSNHVTIWGGRPGRMTYVAYTPAEPICKHAFHTKADSARALVQGMVTLSVFPSMMDVVSCFEPNGIRADWQRVGQDLSAAIRKVAEGEREVA